MTALDKAFIKAYAQELPHTPAAPPQSSSRSTNAMRELAADAVVRESRQSMRVDSDDQPATGAARPLSLFSGAEADTAPPDADPSPTSQTGPIHPAFEVDQVVWPEVCQMLSNEIGDGLDALHERLASAHAGATTSIGLLGIEPQSGCTTVTMTMAHRICRRRSTESSALLLVDANLHNSQIAQAIGLAPQACWKDTDDQRGALADALIESIADRLVVMPLASNQRHASKALDTQRLTRDLQSLRPQYSSTLVDLGSYEVACERGTLGALGSCLDAILLVQDHQADDDARIQQILAQLDGCGVEVAGVIQNRCLVSSCSSKVA